MQNTTTNTHNTNSAREGVLDKHGTFVAAFEKSEQKQTDNSFVPIYDFDLRDADRHRLRNTYQRAMLNPGDRFRDGSGFVKCGRFLAPNTNGATIKEYRTETKTKYSFGNLQSCKSKWACPVCMGKHFPHVFNAINQVAKQKIEAGCSYSFYTLTIPHHLGDSLDDLLQTLSNTWRTLTRSRSFKKLKKRGYYSSNIRRVEITHSFNNGFHPHLHVLMFHNLKINDPDFINYLLQSEQEDFLNDWVNSYILTKGMSFRSSFDRLNFYDELKIRMRPAQSFQHFGNSYECLHDLERISQYLSKDIFEISGDETKTEGSGRNIYQIIQSYRDGNTIELPVLREYYNATKGKKVLTTSRDIKLKDVEFEEIEERSSSVVCFLDLKIWSLLMKDDENRIKLLSLINKSKNPKDEKDLVMNVCQVLSLSSSQIASFYNEKRNCVFLTLAS